MDAQATPLRTGAGLALVSVTLAGWSSVPLFLEYFTGLTDSWTMNGWRYGISAMIWLPAMLLFARRGLPPGLWKAAVIPSLVNATGQSCFALAPYYIDPALMTFMLRFQIIFVAFGAYLLFPAERGVLRTRSFKTGVALAFAGSIGVCLLGAQIPSGATLFGVILAILGGIFFGGYSLSVRYFMNGVNAILAFAVISLMTATVLIIIMLSVGRHHGADPLHFAWAPLGWLLLSAIVGIALAHVTYYAAMARLGVAVAAGMILLQPFLTGAGSAWLYDERLTVWQWLSGVAAMAGAGIMIRAQHRCGREARQRAAAAVAPAPVAPGTRI